MPDPQRPAAAPAAPPTGSDGPRPAGGRSHAGLRTRLLRGLIALSAVTFALAVVLAVVNTRHNVRAELASSAALALDLVDGLLGPVPTLPADAARRADWLERLRELGRHRHLRLDLLAAGEAPRWPPPREAAAPAWFAALVASEPIQFERERRDADGTPLRLLVRADPADELAEAWTDFSDFLLLLAGFALFANLLVWRLLGSALAPLRTILGGLDALAHGDYDHRLPPAGVPELDRIGATVDRLAATLAAGRAENRRLAGHALRVREDERRLLARELHDELGQSLSAIQADAALIAHTARDARHAESARAIGATTADILVSVRELIRRLHPAVLDALGLRAALAQLAADWSVRHAPVLARFEWDPNLPERPACGIHAYRIVQEGLTNVARHAGAGHVDIRLQRQASTLYLELADDGRGCDLARAGTGFGLHGIRERAQSFGGSADIDSTPGHGLRIRVRLPLADGAE